jgi:hypothetical protein
MQNNTTNVGMTHYICNNETCVDENGKRTQFTSDVDEIIHFPYNVIFPNRKRQDFYRNSYLENKPVGSNAL